MTKKKRKSAKKEEFGYQALLDSLEDHPYVYASESRFAFKENDYVLHDVRRGSYDLRTPDDRASLVRALNDLAACEELLERLKTAGVTVTLGQIKSLCIDHPVHPRP